MSQYYETLAHFSAMMANREPALREFLGDDGKASFLYIIGFYDLNCHNNLLHFIPMIR